MTKEYKFKVADRFVAINPDLVGKITKIGRVSVTYDILTSGDTVTCERETFGERFAAREAALIDADQLDDLTVSAMANEYASSLRQTHDPHPDSNDEDGQIGILTLDLNTDLIEAAFAIGMRDISDRYLAQGMGKRDFITPTKDECVSHVLRKVLHEAMERAKTVPATA